MNIPPIPDNSLTEEIKEIVKLCIDLDEIDGSEFSPPATESEIEEWENATGIQIPDSFKEWLHFSKCSCIFGELACFYIPEKTYKSEFVPEGYVIIGDLIGDGEKLCFSISTGKICRFNHGRMIEFDSFKNILLWAIEMLNNYR